MVVFFQEIKSSILNIKAYLHFSKQSLQKTFLYLILFSSLIWILGYIGVYQNMSQGIAEIRTKVIEEVPDFTFPDGRLEVSGPMPAILYKDLTSVVIVDTTGETNENVLNSYRSGLLILSDRLINKREEGRIEEIQFFTFGPMSFTKDDVVSWLPYFKWVYWIVAVAMFIYTAISYLINALWVSLIGLLLNLFMKTKATFGALYKISVYALTLPMLLDTLFSYLRMDLYHLIFYITAAIYVGLALLEMDKELKGSEEADA
ncbi:DUF1189 domain-containing protein [Ammoniphilus sp. YIM 78166]|uniref:DUF1189 domain-containing protein n=1 Tax=Ammoniphilus sp. YIM 78166 TaxID=1644106 RepID=UPI001F0E6F9B|nr:DUF1189 domain-containing protein [Ammoniphilus sp. YIM 78166]